MDTPTTSSRLHRPVLRAVRTRARKAVRNNRVLPKITKAGPPHADFTARDWTAIAARLQREAITIAKWAVDASVDKGARSEPNMLKYLSDVSWQYGQDFDEPWRGETLAWMVKAYRARCERAHSKFEPLVKMKDWAGATQLDLERAQCSPHSLQSTS